MHVRRYFVVCTSTVAAILTLVASINYVVDVSGIYHTSANQSYVRDYARRLVMSRHGLRAIPFERALKLELAHTVQAACYVLGSSHEMGIGNDRMPLLALECKSLVNLGVSGGSFEDAVMQLAALTRHEPTTAFVGLGPWFFKTKADSRWMEFSDEYLRARDLFGLGQLDSPLPSAKLLNLFNSEYLSRNIEVLIRRGALTLPPIIEATMDGSNLADADAIYRPDGSFTRSRKFRSKKRILEVANCTDYKIWLPYVEADIVDEFAAVVRRARSMGIEIRFLLMPYHPGVWKCKNLTAPALRVVEQTVKHLANQLGVAVTGSYDARRYGLEPKDFADYMHINHSSLFRITQER